jgi:hypothetical protein
MNASQRRTLKAFQRAHQFVATLLESAPTPPEGTPTSPEETTTAGRLAVARAMLGQVVTSLTRHAVAQDVTVRRAQEDTRRKAVLAAELRTLHVRPITQIARALLRDVPGIEQALKLPKPAAPTSAVVHAAEAMAQAAKPHERVFVRHGLPADFLTRLRAAADAVAGTVASRSELQGQRVGATAGVREEMQRGRTAVQVLDAVLGVLLADQPRRLVEWRKLKRVVAQGTGLGGAQPSVAPASAPALSVGAGGAVPPASSASTPNAPAAGPQAA